MLTHVIAISSNTNNNNKKILFLKPVFRLNLAMTSQTTLSRLFKPLSLAKTTLNNRIIIAPMCQYSATDGNASAWHQTHLGSLAISGAGLLFLEATAVNPDGRITPYCLGLYSDENERALSQVISAVRSFSTMPLGIQLAHAGRKASSNAPWAGGTLIPVDQGGWQTMAPSVLAHNDNELPPKEMTLTDIQTVIDDFVRSALRAVRMGFDVIELHMAHGYLLHQFLSPLANHRQDNYGGSTDNRLRMPLEVFNAVKDTVGDTVTLGVRLSATDWVRGGWDIEQSKNLCRELEARGCDFIDVSSGGVSPQQSIKPTPGYQVHLASEIKQTVNIPVMAVGLITEPAQAEQILADGHADAIALARAMLFDPRWPWRAANELGETINAPQQYWRCLPYQHSSIFADTKTEMR
jgi:2,4-dienoyl-CoA reductase-like NADH-dependent reductase (Old Yellow Enzyme family)